MSPIYRVGPSRPKATLSDPVRHASILVFRAFQPLLIVAYDQVTQAQAQVVVAQVSPTLVT